MSNSLVSVKNVFKTFTEDCIVNRVLNGINLDVKQSEFVSIMGPSGCGKSTLLYIIGGLDKPNSGSLTVCNTDIANCSDDEQSELRLNKIGFIFQFNNLVQNLSVEENILLPIILAGKNVQDYRSRVDELLTLMNISEKKKSLPSKLSGGQQQRVALARAVITKPQLILADEPTGNLDSQSGKIVLDILKKLNKEHGVAIIMVTHSLEAASYADRVVHMKDGTLNENR